MALGMEEIAPQDQFARAVAIMDLSTELVAAFRLVEMYFMESVHGPQKLAEALIRMKALADGILEADALLTDSGYKQTTKIAVDNANEALGVYGAYASFVESHEKTRG